MQAGPADTISQLGVGLGSGWEGVDSTKMQVLIYQAAISVSKSGQVLDHD